MSKLRIIGTDCAHGVPSVHSDYQLPSANERFIVNVPEGVQRAASEQNAIKLSHISRIFFTRIHPSTAGGFPGLFLTVADCNRASPVRSRIALVGPPGVLPLLLSANAAFCQRGSFAPIVQRNPWERTESQCTAAYPIPTRPPGVDQVVTWVFDPLPRAAKLDAAKAKALGIAGGPKLGLLKRGTAVEADDGSGRIVHPQDVLAGASINAPWAVVDFGDAVAVGRLADSLRSFAGGAAASRDPCGVLRGADKKVVEAYGPVDTALTLLSSAAVVVHAAPSSVICDAAAAYSRLLSALPSSLHIFSPSASAFYSGTPANSSPSPLSPAQQILGLPYGGTVHARSALLLRKLAAIAPHLFKAVDVPLDVPAICRRIDTASNMLPAVPSLEVDLLFYRNCEELSIAATQCFSELLLKARQGSSYDSSETPSKKRPRMQSDAEAAMPPSAGSSVRDAGSPASIDDSFEGVVFLGTGASLPSKYRNVTGQIVVQRCSAGVRHAIALDFGEGSLGQLVRLGCTRSFLADIEAVFISHVHADHHIGLASLAAFRSVIPGAKPLRVLAPLLLKDFFMTSPLFASAGLRVVLVDDERNVNVHKAYPRHGSEFKNMYTASPTSAGSEGVFFSTTVPTTVSAAKLRVGDYSGTDVLVSFHSTSLPPVVAGLSTEKYSNATTCPYVRTVPVEHCLDAHAALVLHASSHCTCEKVVHPSIASQQTLAMTPRLMFSGDTIAPCVALIAASRGTEFVIHEATFADTMDDEAQKKRHSTMGAAVEACHALGAGVIFLTHFSQRFPKAPPAKSAPYENGISGASTSPISVGLAFDLLCVPFKHASAIAECLQSLYPEFALLEQAMGDSGTE